MRHVLLLLCALGSFFLISEVHGQKPSNSVEEWERDLQQAGSDFKCPFVFGSFPDPDDCSHYYICIAGAAFRKKCGMFQSFDMMTRRCLPSIIAICGSNKDKSTTSTSTSTSTVTATATTPDGGNFVCSSFMGSFPHPNDCSKYYSCFMYRHTLKTCSKKELFDAVKKSCQPEAQVHCGTRERPPDLRTTEIPDVTTTEIITTSIEEETTKETTVTDIVTETLPTTLETTEVIITTTEVKPTPPEHDCDEDDLDCIITETGDEWFKCPDDVGSYPHPSSDKLFIFCMNWIPSVKKCGLDLKFSKELATCIKNFL